MVERKFKLGDEVIAVRDYACGVNLKKGTKGKVDYLEPEWYTGRVYFKVRFGDNIWWMTEDDVDFAPKFDDSKIIIYVDGKDVIAKNTKTGKIGKATCHPDDEFDFAIGAKLAFERLMRTVVKQESYEVGDKVKIVDKWNEKTNQNTYGEMDKYLGAVMTIRMVTKNGCYMMEEDRQEQLGLGWFWNKYCIEGKVVDGSIEPKTAEPKKEEPKFKPGDIVELTNQVHSIPKGTRGEFVKYSPMGNLFIDFKFDYGCTHTGDGTLAKRTGRYIAESKLKKVDA